MSISGQRLRTSKERLAQTISTPMSCLSRSYRILPDSIVPLELYTVKTWSVRLGGQTTLELSAGRVGDRRTINRSVWSQRELKGTGVECTKSWLPCPCKADGADACVIFDVLCHAIYRVSMPGCHVPKRGRRLHYQ